MLKLIGLVAAVVLPLWILPQAFAAVDTEQTQQKVPAKELSNELIKLQDELIIEAGKAEDVIYKRGAVYENPAVGAYLNAIAGKFSSRLPQDENIKFSVKIIRDPTVNAFALPNGSIYVHTGALARMENEAQLAMLLGHEISHVLNKDSVYGAHSHYNKTVAYKIFDIALSPAAVFFGILGDLAQSGLGLLYKSTVTGYSREIEARADKDALFWVIDEKYDANAASGLIQVFMDEKEKYQGKEEIYFLMNHPSNERRLNALKEIIGEYYNDANGQAGAEEFLTNMKGIKLYNASLNIMMDRLEHARDDIRWVLEKFPNDAQAHYIAGEICRIEAEDKNKLKYELSSKEWGKLKKGRKDGELEAGWSKEAEDHYKRALDCDPSYSDFYKGMGLLRYKKNAAEALTFLNKYLEAKPEAADKRYIKSLIGRVK